MISTRERTEKRHLLLGRQGVGHDAAVEQALHHQLVLDRVLEVDLHDRGGDPVVQAHDLAAIVLGVYFLEHVGEALQSCFPYFDLQMNECVEMISIVKMSLR